MTAAEEAYFTDWYDLVLSERPRLVLPPGNTKRRVLCTRQVETGCVIELATCADQIAFVLRLSSYLDLG